MATPYAPGEATGRAKTEAERDAVAVCRAKLALAEQVWKRRSSKVERNRKWLSGEFPQLIGAESKSTADRGATVPLATPDIEQINTNLALRMTKRLKADAIDESWEIGYPKAGDMPDEILDDIEGFLVKLVDEAEVPREMDPCIDDIATVGPGILFLDVDRAVVEKSRVSSTATPPSDLIVAAANGAPVADGDTMVPGDPTGVPIEVPAGMDLHALAKGARDFAANPEQQVMRTVEQLENVTLLAQLADLMLEEELDRKPDGYEYGTLRMVRQVYGDDLLWDGQCITSWKDARWVARFLTLTEDEAKKEPAFKPSARKHLKGQEVASKDGWAAMPETYHGASAAVDALTQRVQIVQWWDRDTGEVHYFTKSGCYDGFLERDSSYPWADKVRVGKSIFKHWFPMAACVPVTHNTPVPERTMGKPPIETAEPHQVQYILADSAWTASVKKCGRIIQIPPNLPEDTRSAIENGFDLAIIETPAVGIDENKPMVQVTNYGQAPADYMMLRNAALEAYSVAVDMTAPEMTGAASENTYGQEVEAASGARARRGGLIRKLESWAGDVVYLLASAARHIFTPERVTEMMGPDFTKKDPVPMMDPATGQPVIDPATGQPAPMIDPRTKEPVMLPSVWDLFRDQSMLGDRIEVRFGVNGRGEDLMREKADGDFLAQVLTAVNPVTKLPFKDPRPIFDRIARRKGFGRLKDYRPSQEDMAMLATLTGGGGQEQGGGAPGENGGKGEDRSTPGGGRSDGRRARGERGPAASPGRQSRGQGPGDVGDRSGRVSRTGLA